MRFTKSNALLAAGAFVLAVTGITSVVDIGSARAENTTISASVKPETNAQAIAEGKSLAAASGCAACHTQNNSFVGNQTGQGNVVGGWNAPSLANNASGIGTWSAKDIATYLKTGHNAYADATGPMADVISQSTAHQDVKNLTDIGLYLKSIHGPRSPRPTPIPAREPVMVEGAHIYADECSSCHTDAGTGLPELFPALKANPIVQATIPDTIIRVVLNGAQSVSTPEARTASAMPSFSGQLDNEQVAAVLTYIRNTWGNSAPAVTAADVAKQSKVVAAN